MLAFGDDERLDVFEPPCLAGADDAATESLRHFTTACGLVLLHEHTAPVTRTELFTGDVILSVYVQPQTRNRILGPEQGDALPPMRSLLPVNH
ncbi:hypothetical protein OUW_05518 [Mycobacteroides abscessus M93]|nr:hypothetical protein OUW_05518 [Mycobacteroides abscessus M93]